MSRLIVLSDIHGNLSALESVVRDFMSRYEYDGLVLLGDAVNYGMRSNEVIDVLQNFESPILVNLYGNHEKALMDGDTSRFSTERGRQILEYTRKSLKKSSSDYIVNCMNASGRVEKRMENRSFLFVHASLSDPFWGKMTEVEMNDRKYAEYDYVVVGHSHIPGLTEMFYRDDARPEYRNRKRTIFLNPGSVGQPRNHNSRAQYLYLDTEAEIFHFNSVEYDIEFEQSLYDSVGTDDFYRERLMKGI